MLGVESLGVSLPEATRLLSRMPALETKTKTKKQMATVDCPKSMVGRVIGKNGETIRALQNYSGALIQIDQTVDPMKVTISGTPESLSLAVSMVSDIVNGTFKGFAMLRQIANNPETGDAALCQPVYAPGYGLIPPSQVCNAQLTGATHMANVPSPALRHSPVSPIGMTLGLDQFQEENSPADVILGLTNSIAQLSMDSHPQTNNCNYLSGAQANSLIGASLSSGFQTSPLSSGFQSSQVSTGFQTSPLSSGLQASQLSPGMNMGLSQGFQASIMKSPGQLNGLQPISQVGSMGLASSPVDLHAFQASQTCKNMVASPPSLELDSEMQSLGAFRPPKQLGGLTGNTYSSSSSPPPAVESLFSNQSNTSPVRSVSAFRDDSADASTFAGWVHLRDPNGRSFYLDPVSRQTHWVSDLDCMDSLLMAQ
ncbi:hypothetical protein BSKO_09666 [Bryopsis sp. KO-2023]|nr:hypothetical protein BSKO_09666 [Bryopsis sp. KO-2023]